MLTLIGACNPVFITKSSWSICWLAFATFPYFTEFRTQDGPCAVLTVPYLPCLGALLADRRPQAKRVTDITWTMCGTPEYLAPEIIMNKGCVTCPTVTGV